MSRGSEAKKSLGKILSGADITAKIEMDNEIEEFDQSVFLVALKKDGEDAGDMKIEIRGEVLVFHRLVLSEDAQQNGYFTHLSDVLPSWARENDIKEFRLYAPEGDGRQIFINAGYEPVDANTLAMDISGGTSRVEQYVAYKRGEGDKPSWLKEK